MGRLLPAVCARARLILGLVLLVGPIGHHLVYGARADQLEREAISSVAHGADRRSLRVADSYRSAKRRLFERVVADRRETLYCGCRFDRDKRPDAASCGYVPADPRSERAQRVEVEHVIPASWIGAERRCWRERICTDGSGRRIRGRDCCEAIDPDYQRAANDLQNLWPSLGELNQERTNFRFGEIAGEPRAYGGCDFEVDRRAGMVEPRPEVRGDIARIGLYMEAVHGIWLSRHHRDLFAAWSRADPPDAREHERNERIRGLQDMGNPFIESYEEHRARVVSPGGAPAAPN